MISTIINKESWLHIKETSGWLGFTYSRNYNKKNDTDFIHVNWYQPIILVQTKNTSYTTAMLNSEWFSKHHIKQTSYQAIFVSMEISRYYNIMTTHFWLYNFDSYSTTTKTYLMVVVQESEYFYFSRR